MEGPGSEDLQGARGCGPSRGGPPVGSVSVARATLATVIDSTLE